MYILGIDYGTKKLGFAILETDTGITSQLPILKNNINLMSEITTLLSSYRISTIVMGMPSYEDTKIKVLKFAELLTEVHPDIEIQFTNEDNTSIVIKKGLESEKQKKNLDSMSAVAIVQQWYTDKF